MASLAPTSGAERIVSLDALRGFALFGVLLVNLPFMAFSTSEALATPDPGTEPIQNVVAWVLEKSLFETKFFTIFSFLFGIGLVLSMRRAEAAGRPFARLYLRRLGWLALIGLLHGTLLFEGDILLPYAIAGLLLFPCRNMRPARLVAAALVPLVIGIGLSALWAYTGRLESIDWAVTEKHAIADGPLLESIRLRAFDYAAWLFYSTLISFNWRVLAMFFLGAAAMKADLLGRMRGRDLVRAVALGLLVGGSIEGAVVASRLVSPTLEGAVAVLRALAEELGSLVLSAGYAAGVVLLVRSGRVPRLVHGLASAGRMALTSYLSQSILANLLFMGFGLALFGQLSRAELLLLAVVVFAAQVLFSVVWLRIFRFGPFEWVWRRLTYGRLSLRRVAA